MMHGTLAKGICFTVRGAHLRCVVFNYSCRRVGSAKREEISSAVMSATEVSFVFLVVVSMCCILYFVRRSLPAGAANGNNRDVAM